MLRIEGIGAVRFSPDERSIVLEYLPPYHERGQYGVDRGGRILEVSLEGQSVARPLFEHRSGTKYWLGDASPDGRRLLVFQASRQQVRLGVFDFESKGLTLINETLQVNERFEMNRPIWLNDHEIVFSSRAEVWSHYDIRMRPHVVDRTFALQERAFAGASSVASVSTNPDDHWYDGALLRYDTDTKRASVLGRGRFGDIKLSADGRKMAALRLGQRLLHFSVTQLTDFFRFDTQLFIFDLENNSSRTFLPNTHVSMGSLRWSIDASKLSFFAWDRNEAVDEGAHRVLDTDTASITPVRFDGFTPSGIGTARLGARNSPIAAEWLHNELIVHGVLSAPIRQPRDVATVLSKQNVKQKAKWFRTGAESMTAETVLDGGRQRHAVYRFRDGRLLLQSDDGFFVASEGATPIALDVENHDEIRILNGSVGDEIESIIVFAASRKKSNEIGFFDLSQDKVVVLTAEAAISVDAWAPNTHQVVVRADGDVGGALYWQGPAKTPKPLFIFNHHLSEVEHPHWETIEYRGADGADTFSCILLPYNYDPKMSYPTIVDVYPGTGKGCRRGTQEGAQALGASVPFHNNNDVLAAAGYLVLRPSNTYELNHSDGTVFGGLKAQVDAALDALVDAGMTDPERIGIWGFSNGSMASLWLASVSDRYKAVIPMFGGSSAYIEYFGGTSPPRFQLYHGAPILHLAQYESEIGTMPHSMGRSAISDPLRYVQSSPLDRANHICSPVMMVHSDLDSFTPYHYEALFSAMYRLGKRAELVRYYGEEHGLRSPGNIRDFYERVLAFFDKHVEPGTPLAPCN